MKSIRNSALFAVCISLSASVLAGWSSTEARLGGPNGKPTWVYTPNSSIAGNPNIIDGKRALMVNLHGCAQSNEDLKDAGNWVDVAEDYGMVIAIPFAESSYPGCWDYNFANDNSSHAAILVNIVNELLADTSLQIDSKQVYVSGLSSGGAMTLQLACEYPQVFAGIGSVAGPSVGSDQDGEALGNVPAGNITRGINKCNQLASASGHAGDLQTQISSLAYGDHDLNGSGSGAFGQGTIALVDVNWVTENADIIKSVYGAGSLSGADTLIDAGGATAEERVSSRNGKEVISILELQDVGHAWPAGDKGSEWSSGGAYLNKSGFEYPVYLTEWLFANNLRVDGGGIPGNNTPTITLPSGPYEYDLGDNCTPSATAFDIEDGDLTSQIQVTGSANCNTAGSYTLTYSVSDQAGASTSETITVVVNGAGPGYDEVATATCAGHYTAGRLDLNEYLACGTANGYSASVTLYRFGTCWTESSNGNGC